MKREYKTTYQPQSRTYLLCPICGGAVKKEVSFIPYNGKKGAVEECEVKAYVPGIIGPISHIEKPSGVTEHRVNTWHCPNCNLGFRYKDVIKHVIKVATSKSTMTCKDFKAKIN